MYVGPTTHLEFKCVVIYPSVSAAAGGARKPKVFCGRTEELHLFLGGGRGEGWTFEPVFLHLLLPVSPSAYRDLTRPSPVLDWGPGRFKHDIVTLRSSIIGVFSALGGSTELQTFLDANVR